MEKPKSNVMKKLGMLFFATVFIFSFVNTTYAKTTLCEGQFAGVLEASEQQFPNATTTLHLGTTDMNVSAAYRCAAYDFLLGGVGATVAETPEELLENAKNVRGGIATDMFSSAYSLFNAMPTENIPGFYAEMFVPKEFQQSTGSLFAVNCTEGSSLNGVVTRPPACQSTYEYWDDFGLSKLWSISFTIAMIAVVGVLVVAGFMIMFRSKVKDAQKIISISVALQNIVVASALSLASFALGAFFVNFSKFLTLIIADMFSQLLWLHVIPGSGIIEDGLNNGINTLIGSTYISNPLGIFIKFIFISFVGDIGAAASNVGSGVLGGYNGASNGFLDLLKQTFFFGQAQSNQWLIKSPLYIIGRIIAAGVLFWYSLRIWVATLGVFLNMAFDTITAPLVFVMSAIPGKQGVIQNWFKKMMKNSLTVPLMFAVVNIAAYVILFFGFNGMLNDGSINPLEAISGGYYGAGGSINASTAVTDFAGIIFAGVGPAFLLMLLILSFVPKIPAFMDEIIITTPTSATAKGGIAAFGAQMGGLAGSFMSGKNKNGDRGKGLFRGIDSAGRDSWRG
jgi:hypothetical protein